MSTRNPLNDRYMNDERHGVSRKSAASAKPKTKAAATVYIKPTEKTPQEKRAAQRAARQKEAERQRQYSVPDTPRYKKFRRIWWILMGIAVVFMVLSWVLQEYAPGAVSYVFIGLAYVTLLAAFVLEFTKVSKERKLYAADMEKKLKEARIKEKKERARQARQNAQRRNAADSSDQTGIDEAGHDQETNDASKNTKMGLLFRLRPSKATSITKNAASEMAAGDADTNSKEA